MFLDAEYIVLDSFHIQEHEIWLGYEDLQIDAGIVEDISRDLDAVINFANVDHCLAYVTSDSVWYAAIKPGDLQTAIAESVA